MKKQGTLENQVNYAYLALGTNLGNKIKNLEIAKYEICEKNETSIMRSSSFYSSKSWPNPKFPDYINIVILIKTKLLLHELFKKIKIIEKNLGRIKSPKNYPRICDIDIIDYNGAHLLSRFKNQKIEVPHLSMHKRNFVLVPLYEINNGWLHPKLKKNIINLLSSLPVNDLRSIKLI